MKKIRNLILFFAMIMVLSGVNVYAASVGNKLTSPEEGWKRYDDNDSKIIYKGAFLISYNNKCYNATAHWLEFNPVEADTNIKFKFLGSKLRIIGTIYPDLTQAFVVKVDGKEYTFSAAQGDSLYQGFIGEITDLTYQTHNVEIYSSDNQRYTLDAIDIDEDGYLLSVDKKIKLILEVKDQKQLSVTDELTDNTEMTWTSSDITIATVEANGKVKALKPGDTVITCKNEDGSYTEIIDVLVVDLDLQLAVDLNIGEKCRLTVGDLMNSVKVTWKADDSTIATVSSKGKITAISEGLTYISVLDETGKELGRIYVRVR